MSLIEKFESILVEEDFLPVSKEKWSSFQITHCQPDDNEMKMEQFKFIKKQVGKKAGVYIYIKDKSILYIGKAKGLNNRLKSHYIESFSTVPGDTKDNRWHRFFSQHQGEVNVLWKEVETEEERQIIEIILTHIMKPVFLSFR